MFCFHNEVELQKHIAENFNDYFNFKLLGKEVRIGSHRRYIDLLGEDDNFTYLIEIKKDIPTIESVHQIKEYMDLYRPFTDKKIVGFIASPDINSKNLINELSKYNNIKLKKINGVSTDKDNFIKINFSLPVNIYNKLDKDAKKELRTRSKQVAKIILDYYNYNDDNEGSDN